MLLTAALVTVVAGSIVYCLLTLIAAQSYRMARPARSGQCQPISVLKPLSGAEERLEQNLRTFFIQDYPDYEILFAVRVADDPAVAVVRKLCAEYPTRFVRMTVTGDSASPNGKVYSLDLMRAAARHELLVMSDSDIHAAPDMLATLAAEFADPRVGMVTCPYRAVPGRSFWSQLEAIGMNTQFLGAVLVARLLEGMKFALGPTIAARKSVLNEIGFERLKDYLAEDFVMGKWTAELGSHVLLSSCIVEHHIGGQETGFADTVGHRLRWARSTRRSRPSGYVGQLFTMPLPPALLLWLWAPQFWPLAALAMLARAGSAVACAGWVLRDGLTARRWWLLPLEDLLAFAIWLAGFFGSHIVWRGRTYRLYPDGRFEVKA